MDPLESWRRRKVLPYIRGRLLDVGCGYNNLVRSYPGPGIGVDVFPWPGIDVQIGDASTLPFPTALFDTVTIVAALNHIPNRQRALEEMHRVLRPQGRLIVTMIGPLTGVIAHLLFRQDDRVRGGMLEGERQGLRSRDVRRALSTAGFTLTHVESFQFALNRVYVGEKLTAA